MKKCTLQVRITIIAGIILLAACLLLTANSLLAAHTYYGDYEMLIQSGQAMKDPAIESLKDHPQQEASESYYEASQKFSLQTVLAMALIVLLALGLTYWAAGWMLRPLKKLTESIGAVDDQHLHQRVSLDQAQGEVLQLTESFNHMLGRLEDSFAMQKRFAANAAHELKTPLAIIKSSLQVLKMDPDPATEDYREFMQDTEQSLGRIISTVEGLLALANSDTLAPEEEIELRPLLEQAARELKVQAQSCGIELFLTGAEKAAVRADASLLYRAFYNLIENAIKYNRPGGKVFVMLQDADDKICVQIKDTGIGMEEKELQHIFEPFYRADPSRSQKIPGSGLGLAVTQTIIERCGGKLSVQSKPGEGSVFCAVLPSAGASPAE